MITTTATVLRKAKGKKEIDIKELVPGRYYLSFSRRYDSGRLPLSPIQGFIHKPIHAYRRITACREKSNTSMADPEKPAIIELDNICFMGTNVVSGIAAIAIIVYR